MPPRVVLKPRRAKPFWFGEPWVFDGSIDRVKGAGGLTAGDTVEVVDDGGRPIGSGFWSPTSAIRVRLVAWGDEVLDEALIEGRLRQAIALRRDTGLDQRATAYRVVHAEGDGLPGLIVDRLADQLVIQLDIAGIRRFKDVVIRVLQDGLAPRGIYERVSRMAREEEELEGEEGVVCGEVPDDGVLVEENGVRYTVDLQRGQKTGFYSDQRDNRRTLTDLAQGRRVLDAFSYTGAFALNLVKNGGAVHAVAVDSSEPALENARRNLVLNDVTAVETVRANVLRYLDHARKDGTRFDLVVLDPPKLAPRRADLRRAVKLYQEINHKGLSVLEPGGLLATCSCSQVLSELEFSGIVAEAAREADRRLQLLHVGSQGLDHPLMVPHEASRYLKFHIYRVVGG